MSTMEGGENSKTAQKNVVESAQQQQQQHVDNDDEISYQQQHVGSVDDDDEDDNNNSNNGEQQDSDYDAPETSSRTAARQQQQRRLLLLLKFVIGLVLMAFIIFVVVDTATTKTSDGSNSIIIDGIKSFLRWMEDHVIMGLFLFIAVYLIATVLFIPGSLLTLGSGFVFASAYNIGLGIVLGVISVFIGASLGAIISFLLGRFLLRQYIQEKLLSTNNTKFKIFSKVIDTVVHEKGFRIFLLLRLSPIVPFNVLNYIAGITSVTLRDYTTSLIGILPGTILYVFLGASAGSLTDIVNDDDDDNDDGSNDDDNNNNNNDDDDEDNDEKKNNINSFIYQLMIFIMGAILGIMAIWMTTYYARKEFNEIVVVQEDQEEEEREDNNRRTGTRTITSNGATRANRTINA